MFDKLRTKRVSNRTLKLGVDQAIPLLKEFTQVPLERLSKSDLLVYFQALVQNMLSAKEVDEQINTNLYRIAISLLEHLQIVLRIVE